MNLSWTVCCGIRCCPDSSCSTLYSKDTLMGLFGRRQRPSLTRVAEGGSSEPTGATKSASDDLALFGADSDESDDDATIERYANGSAEKDGGEEKETDTEDAERRKVSVLLSKLTPEELFKRYDIDGSGSISISEFLAMLPDLGIRMSEAKAIRVFKKCDTDGGGAIDLNEFKMAMFAVDPVSGNTQGFTPSQFLSPKDAFELFDEDGTGQIDELEFADVLEYFGMDVSDAKQEALFKKYDKDKSGYIDYKEFRSMWLRLTNVREELTKRGVEIPKYTTPLRLQQILEEILDVEEAREAQVLAEAQHFLQQQREQQKRAELGRRAIIRAQDELAAALDAAGQVYVLGAGKYEQFAGQAVPRDEDLFPGFRAVSAIWSYRVDPLVISQPTTTHHMSDPEQQQQSPAPVEKRSQKVLMVSASAQRKGDRYVRRRPENRRWTFRSPPKLNCQTQNSLKREIKAHAIMAGADDCEEETLDSSARGPESQDAPVERTILPTDEEELARLFYQDRERVRSLRFRSTVLMKNTGSLWGRGVVQGALSDDVAFAVTSTGAVFTWGGKTNTWERGVRRVSYDDNLDDEVDSEMAGRSDRIDGDITAEPRVNHDTDSDGAKATPRSMLVKMATKEQLKGLDNPELESREEESLEADIRQREEDGWYERLKAVVVYYEAWEPPPSNATRVRFLEQVLLPKLVYETMIESMTWRGVPVERATKMELMLQLGECLQLECEFVGMSGQIAIKTQENSIRRYLVSKDKREKSLVEEEKQKLRELWAELKRIREERHAQIFKEKQDKERERINRMDASFEAIAARRLVQRQDLVPEFTTRGRNAKIDLSGITSRGPSLHSPRGRVAAASIAAGGAHVALLLQDGSVYTWGIGSTGRLGHPRDPSSSVSFDSDHPQLVDAFRDVRIRQLACAFSHSGAVSDDGELYMWGSTTNGKLGVGVVEDCFEQNTVVPLTVKFPGKRHVRSVSCGAAHSGAVTTNGEVFMWGCANGGRLGLGPHVKDAVAVPTIVRDFVTRKLRVWQVACGHSHSALCTEIISEQRGGSKKLLGGQVFVCGGAIPLGRYVTSWESVPALQDVGIRQISCGATHTAAVSAYGELYTWGRNDKGCTGHNRERGFIQEPELVRSLHVEPYNLALGKPCRQINIYNEHGPQIAVNGDVDGRLEKCIHTHLEEKPWWEVDLGQPAVIERIRVWNRTDEPTNPSKSRSEYTVRLFPFWILISEFPFKDLEGKEGLRAAKTQSAAFEQFTCNQRMTEWVLPTAHTIGQYVRIQLQNRNFLHLAEVEVFGVYSAFNYVGRVGTAHCGNEVTLVIVPPTPQQSALDDYYLRAIQADADHATILRQYEAYERSYRLFGRGNSQVLGAKCRLCRVFRECEICELYSNADIDRFRSDRGELLSRLVGDRLGLNDLVKLAVEELEDDRTRTPAPTTSELVGSNVDPQLPTDVADSGNPKIQEDLPARPPIVEGEAVLEEKPQIQEQPQQPQQKQELSPAPVVTVCKLLLSPKHLVSMLPFARRKGAPK